MRFEPSRYQVERRTSRVQLRLHRRTIADDHAHVTETTAQMSVSNTTVSFPSCSSAVRTIKLAMSGLAALEESLQADMRAAFERAVHAMQEAKGRVIVTGMGKSGHIGAKIAATLASTGTPAFFVHPAEASHGDLGMITPDDVVLALSWSGETNELKNIVVYSRRFRIPLIAITAGDSSTLARGADVALILPRVEDVGAPGPPPTTSTLMQLALGDALAVALLERCGFTVDDFYGFHPGGSLGARLARVRDMMRGGDRLPLTPLGTPMAEALLVMTRHGCGCLGIVDADDALVGIITDGDVRRHVSPGILEQRVDDVMTRDPKHVRPDTLAASALEILNRNSISAVFVVEHQRAVGIVHLHDLLRIGVQ
jgi:arabinose-5-phosphate isomerase